MSEMYVQDRPPNLIRPHAVGPGGVPSEHVVSSMLVTIDEIIGAVLQLPVESHRMVWHFDPHQDICPFDAWIHPSPEFYPPQKFLAADL